MATVTECLCIKSQGQAPYLEDRVKQESRVSIGMRATCSATSLIQANQR